MTGIVIEDQGIPLSKGLKKWLRDWGGDLWPWREIPETGGCHEVLFWNSTIRLMVGGRYGTGHLMLFTRGELKAAADAFSLDAGHILNLARSAFGTGPARPKERPEVVPLDQRLTDLSDKCLPKYCDIVRTELKECAALAEGMQKRIATALVFIRAAAASKGKTEFDRVNDLTNLAEILEAECEQ